MVYHLIESTFIMVSAIFLLTFFLFWDIQVLRRLRHFVLADMFVHFLEGRRRRVRLLLGIIVFILLEVFFNAEEFFIHLAELKIFFIILVGAGLGGYLFLRRRFLRGLALVPIQPLQGNDIAHRKTILISDALGVILHWSLIMLIIEGLMKIKGAAAEEISLIQLVFMGACSFIILMAFIVEASRRFSLDGFWRRVGLTRVNIFSLRSCVIPALSGLFLACVSATIIAVREVQPVTPLGEILDAADSPLAILAFIVLAILAAPLIEEVIFRGYFFRVLKDVKGSPAAIVVISLIFTFMHVGQYWGDWGAIGMVFLMGCLLTILRALSQTLTASVIGHYAYNGGLMVIAAWLGV